MSPPAREVSYREVASALAPEAVSQYLATQNWELETRQDRVREIWRLPGGDGRPKGQIMLPLAVDYEDFFPRFTDALPAIGKINGWDAEKRRERIVSAHADQD